MNTTIFESLDLKKKVGNYPHASSCLSIQHSEETLAVLTLDEDGTICECNQAAATLLDCAPYKVTSEHISTLLPQLSETALMKGECINPYFRYLSHIGYHFEMIGASGVHFACALFFMDVNVLGRHCLRLMIKPAEQDYGFA